MRTRPLGVLSCLLVAIFLLTGGCATDSNRLRTTPSLAGATSDAGFRAPEPDGSTVFSPLDLPAASAARLGSGAPGPAYWQQRADYRIDATLHEGEQAVSATGTITYHNNSPDTLTHVWLHLEQNLFRPDSLGSLSKEPGSRFGYRKGFEGGYELGQVSVDGTPVELHVYDTLGRIDLPNPLQPGGSISIELSWRFNVPPFGVDRLSVEEVEQGVVFQIAQWFPAVAVYDDVHGWNTLPYLGQGEFYTNFGDYEVTITAPRSHVVVATGTLTNAADVLTTTARERLDNALRSNETIVIRSAEEVGAPSAWPAGEGSLTWRFSARNVRTFAWASSAAFVWDAAGLDVRGSAQAPNGRVLVQSVYPKEALPLWGQATQMARHAIDFNSRQWHPYPYPTAINVNGRVGGMEYPMIVFCAERHDERGLYGVTDHEFGHTWFPMLVNTDERRYAWMDEGFNSFMNVYTVRDRYGDGARDRRSDVDAFTAQMARGQQQPITPTYADHVWRGRLGFLMYGKPAAALVLLREEVLGEERFDAAFRAYIDRWAFKHPQPADFFRTMEDVAGTDLAWFWRGWFLSTATLDQAVTGVEHTDDGSWVRVYLASRRDMVMPVRMRVYYDDGTSDERRLPVEIWATTTLWTDGWNPAGRRVVEVVVDPDNVLPDVDRSNNRWADRGRSGR